MPDIPNGTVSTDRGLSAGQKATYSCNHGYHVVGNVTRTCLENGTWDGNEPTCQITSENFLRGFKFYMFWSRLILFHIHVNHRFAPTYQKCLTKIVGYCYFKCILGLPFDTPEFLFTLSVLSCRTCDWLSIDRAIKCYCFTKATFRFVCPTLRLS